MLLKKAVYDKLMEKVDNIDTTGFVLKQSMAQVKKSQKIKFLILVGLLKIRL